MKKHVLIGTTPDGPAFATIQWDGKTLSIVGVIGPKANGNAEGPCGQIDGTLRALAESGRLHNAPDLSDGDIARLLEVWGRWHLNDMRAGCEHQRAEWDTAAKITVKSYGLTAKAHRMRAEAQSKAFAAERENRVAGLDAAESFLLGPDWFKEIHSQPAEGDPRFGLFEEREIELKPAGQVYPSEHPEGLLTKPCTTCGYKYGSSWLREDVPADVIAFLESLPETNNLPAAWAR